MGFLTRDQILEALGTLAAKLGSTARPVRLVMMGGAAMVVLYEARSATKDVDAVLLDVDRQLAVRQAALEVARDLGLPEDWLNEGAKGYLHGLDLGEVVLDRPSLLVQVPFLVPGRELKAQYALADIWEAQHGAE